MAEAVCEIGTHQVAQCEWIMQQATMTSHCPRPACECVFWVFWREKFLFLSIQIHLIAGQTTMYLVSLESSLKM